MRLIDADELIERMGKWMTKACGRVQTVEERVASDIRRVQTVEERVASDITASVCMEIEETPTAFDKGKVLEELKKHADIAIETNGAYGSEVAFGEWSAYKQAEEIVKKGGIE